MKSSNKINAGVETIKISISKSGVKTQLTRLFAVDRINVFCFCKNRSQSSPLQQPLSLNSFIQQNIDAMYLVIHM